jgi:hypothetical protein
LVGCRNRSQEASRREPSREKIEVVGFFEPNNQEFRVAVKIEGASPCPERASPDQSRPPPRFDYLSRSLVPQSQTLAQAPRTRAAHFIPLLFLVLGLQWMAPGCLADLTTRSVPLYQSPPKPPERGASHLDSRPIPYGASPAEAISVRIAGRRSVAEAGIQVGQLAILWTRRRTGRRLEGGRLAGWLVPEQEAARTLNYMDRRGLPPRRPTKTDEKPQRPR